jgi:hypothetical protein
MHRALNFIYLKLSYEPLPTPVRPSAPGIARYPHEDTDIPGFGEGGDRRLAGSSKR